MKKLTKSLLLVLAIALSCGCARKVVVSEVLQNTTFGTLMQKISVALISNKAQFFRLVQRWKLLSAMRKK